MLDNYEQKKLVEYLLEALSKLNTRTVKYYGCKGLDELISTLDNAIQDGKINIELDYKFEDENKQDKQITAEDFFKKKTQKSSDDRNTANIKILKVQLKKAYKKFQNAKLSNREKSLRVIKNIFALSDEEADILGLIIRNITSETFSDCCSCLAQGNFGRNDDKKKCKTYLKNSSTVYDSIKRLEEYGLLHHESYRGNELGIPAFIENIFNSYTQISEQEIVEKVMGKSERATLKKSDFEHLKSEFNMVQLILKNALKEEKKGINILLYGEVGTGKTEFAKTLARCLKVPLYETAYEDNDKEEANRYNRLADLMRKEAICKNIEGLQLILFDEAEDLLNDTFFNVKTNSKAYINKMLENNTTPIIWTTNDIKNMDKAYLRRFTYAVKFEELSDEVQLKFMKKEFEKNKFDISDEEIIRLSKKYDLSSSVITNSIMLTKLTNSKNSMFEDFIKNQATLLNRGKEKSENFNVNKKSENYSFDLVNTDTDVHKLTEQIKNTGKFNFSLCLYGEAGTGKSEYAKQLADKLGFEVIFKRASDIMSKWVGETEQNIAMAFKEARDKNAILIFDEADSLLQSRGNAQRSWEISQVNEMLTWMESHPYPFICTTNFMDSLDEASLRRFTFKIKFKYMTSEQVKLGFKHFFNKEVDEEIANIKGLTAGDFATVKKKIEFLGTDDVFELKELLQKEVEVKKSKELSSTVGF